MSLFSSILSKIFPPDHPANATPAGGTPGPGGAAAPVQSAATGGTPAATPGTAAASGGAQGPTATSATPQQVDVYAVLSGIQAERAEQLNWQTSIVDLLKLLDLDSSLSARKELATELHYTGSMDDSATMNVWLHKEVMNKLAENGGKVPDDLKH